MYLSAIAEVFWHELLNDETRLQLIESKTTSTSHWIDLAAPHSPCGLMDKALDF